jgi:tRNA pseudouridine13 synthase
VTYLTREVPGCGGQFKESPDDFEVEEIPAYGASGEGEHLLVWVEKRGLSTPELIKLLASAFGVKERDVGSAGLKDRHAVTRQLLSFPAKQAEPALASAVLPEQVKVLWAKRHGNKVKTGHLKGNRFTLVVRGVADADAANATLRRLAGAGLPNRFGLQRFGARGDNAARGKALLEGRGKAPRFERKLYLSAYQSLLFNRVVDQRLADGTWNTAQRGDVLKKHESGGEFVCADPVVDQPRCDAFEVSPTGPMFGPTMRQPDFQVLELENRILADEGIDLALFRNGGDETAGTRRLLRVPIHHLSWALAESLLTLRFTLPPGSYATELLRELLKPPSL